MATIATDQLRHIHMRLTELAERGLGRPPVYSDYLAEDVRNYLRSIRTLCEAQFPGATGIEAPSPRGWVTALYSAEQAQAVYDREAAVLLAIRLHAVLRGKDGRMVLDVDEISDLAGIERAYGAELLARGIVGK